jgi:hypothetical protein
MQEELEDSVPRISCPKCGSMDVRRSRSEGLVGLLARTFGRWPFRCRSCRTKFYRPAEPPNEF